MLKTFPFFHLVPSQYLLFVRKSTILLLSICSFICCEDREKSFNGKIVSFLLRWDSREIYEHFHNWLNLNLSCLQAKVLNTCLCLLWYMTFLHCIRSKISCCLAFCVHLTIYSRNFLDENFGRATTCCCCVNGRKVDDDDDMYQKQ